MMGSTRCPFQNLLCPSLAAARDCVFFSQDHTECMIRMALKKYLEDAPQSATYMLLEAIGNRLFLNK